MRGEIVSGVAKLGTGAESLARTAAHRTAGYMESSAFAGPYLADQLLLPMALAGRGRFTTVKPTEHTRKAARVIERFTGRSCRFAARAGGGHDVVVK